MNETHSGALVAAALATTFVLAQGDRPASLTGSAAAEVRKYVAGAVGPVYHGGKWIEILYGRLLKRGRDVLGGAGANHGKVAIAGGAGYPDAPVWRAGANESTRLKTEVASSSTTRQSYPASRRCSSN